MDHMTSPSPPPSSKEDITPSSFDDTIAHDSDYKLLKQYIQERLTEASPPPITKVLSSSARILSKFPTNEDAVVMVIGTILPQILPLLPPDEPPSQVMEVQMNALEALSQLDISTTPSLVGSAMTFFSRYWLKYPTTLPATCNIKQLSFLFNAAMQLECREDAIKHGDTFVLDLMSLLSESQLEALEREGVYKSVRGLLRHYELMDEVTLRHIIAGMGLFANVKPCTQQFLEENLHFDLLFAAQKFPTAAMLQKAIWQVLTLFCLRDKGFALAISETEVLSTSVNILKQDKSNLQSLLGFFSACCQVAENVFYAKCLNEGNLVQFLLEIIKSDSSAAGEKNNAVDFLALLCSKAPKSCLPRLLELKLVSEMEEVARIQPEVGVIPTYLAIEGLIMLLSQEQTAKSPDAQAMIDEFYSTDHHLFLQHALASPLVSSNQSLLEMIYLTLQRLLKLITPEALKRAANKEFFEVLCISFVRDTASFPLLTNRVAFATHFLVFQIRVKESIELLKEVNFHQPVIELFSTTHSHDVVCTSLGLLACFVSKYYEFLKDLTPFFEARVPTILMEKATSYGHLQRSSFGDEMSRILLNLTAEKELSLKLFKDGFLDLLLANLKDSYTPVVKRCIIHAVGNIAIGGQNVKEVLYKHDFHMKLLGMLSREAEKGDASQLSACCRVLHILASGDAVKRQFVENDCIKVLLKIITSRKDSPEICWRPLGLLSTLGFMALISRHFILTQDVVEKIVKILKEDKHGKVLGYTMLVFLAYLQIDSGSLDLRQMAIEDRVRVVSKNADYQKQSTELERWGNHVIEQQDLYTVATPASLTAPPCLPEDCKVSDWPFQFHCPEKKLLPLTDPYFDPQTPKAINPSPSAKEQLRQLGLNPDSPLFRVGRVYGCTYGWCSNCDREGSSYELVMRVQSMTPFQYQHLVDNGWYRRGGVKMFRMMHNHSASCCDWETRVSVSQFKVGSHKSYKKVLRRMPTDRLTIETLPNHFSREAFDLYNSYHILRHDKPQKSEFSYCEHVVNSPVVNQTIDGVEYGTFHQLYRLDGKLVAVGIIDVIPKGMVSIYMWYDVTKEVAKHSYGVYSALKEIEMVQERNSRDPSVQYYYLQGWNPHNNKLSYKANYQPEEFYCPGVSTGWVGSIEEVNKAIEELATKKTPAEQEAMDTSDDKDSKTPTNTEETDSAPSSKPGASKETKGTDKDTKGPCIPCESIDTDRPKHLERTGSSSADISKIIVCVNYTQYMHLGELFEKFQIEASQRELMEKRYEELYLALCPELTEQLVIDLKATFKHGAVQVSDNVGVSVDPPTAEEQQVATGALVF